VKYQRVLLKVSGEALAGEAEHGIDTRMLVDFCQEVKEIVQLGVQVGIVVGGGNIHRGISGVAKGMNRSVSDHMGMLATVINALALQDGLQQQGVPTRVLSSIEMNSIAEPYTYRAAMKYMANKEVIIFAGGTGNPYFTTDTTAALRASEIGAQVVLKATKVDGIYDDDPMRNPNAKKFDRLTFMDVLKKQLKVMDATAISLCMENKIEIIVFDIFEKNNIRNVITGHAVGTLVTNG